MTILKRPHITAVFLLTAAVYLSSCAKDAGLDRHLTRLGVTVSGIQGFMVKDSGEGHLVAGRDMEIIRIKTVDGLDGPGVEAYIKEQSAMLLGVFDPRLPPYPEFMTRASGCPDKYKPVRKEGRYGPYYLLYAGKRLTYGGCSEDLIEYRASIGFFYLPEKKRVIRLEYFIPKDRDIDALISLNDSVSPGS